MSTITEDQGLLEAVVARLQAEGFDVYVDPPQKDVPEFLRGIVSPDAIARRADKKIIVEISRESPEARRRSETIIEKVLPHSKEWEFRVYWANPSASPKRVERMSKDEIEAAIKVVENLVSQGQTSPALLMAWSAFEALGRALMPIEFVRPQTPGRLVEVLASAYLTPDEADQLRRLAASRDALIHGELRVAVSKEEISKFIKVLRTVTRFLREAQA
jgi:uncharacterized protein YutE (UPF0331/DUF86 family)